MARTDAIREAVARELEHLRRFLDSDILLRSVTIDVKMVADTGLPRVVIVSTQTESKKC